MNKREKKSIKNTTAVTQSPVSAQHKKTPLVLAAIAFVVLSVTIFIFGPLLWIKSTEIGNVSWFVAPIVYVFYMLNGIIVAPISLVLYLIGSCMAIKNSSPYLINILIMLSGSVLSLAALLIPYYIPGIYPTHPLTVVLTTLFLILPCIGLLVLYYLRRKNPKLMRAPRSIQTVTIIALIIFAVVVIASVLFAQGIIPPPATL